VLPYKVLELRYYLTAGGESPFESWFSELDAAAAAKVSVALVGSHFGVRIQFEQNQCFMLSHFS
jgi:hypothetical protein